jgi:hypothetical protein
MRPTTQRTKQYFEQLGCLVGHVEKWIPQIKRRQDLWGLFDQVVVGFEPFSTLYVQSCAGSSHAAHKAKMLANPNLGPVLKAGNGVALVSWRTKKVKRGGKAVVWVPRLELFSLKEIP